VISRLGRRDVQFVDVRPMSAFEGVETPAARGGHIPGARHVPASLNLREDGTLLPLRERRALYATLDARAETIVYGDDAVEGAMTCAILTRLGFRSVRLYVPGWREYGNDPEAPLETTAN
jgi:thiosulfate/3-mercaptopyruvate sulfurtransferase